MCFHALRPAWFRPGVCNEIMAEGLEGPVVLAQRIDSLSLCWTLQHFGADQVRIQGRGGDEQVIDEVLFLLLGQVTFFK